MIALKASRAAESADNEQFRIAWSMFHDALARQQGRARRIARRCDSSLDLLAWGQRYLPDHFCLPPSNMHRWLAEQLDAAQRTRGTKINVLGPRGGAKSTIGTLALPLRAAVECWEPYVWIVSDTKHQACAHLENIKTELLENQRLAKDFPEVVGRGLSWRGNSIVLRNGVMIEAFGSGQRIRGRRRRQHRPTLIVCDDLQNDGHIGSALQREHSRSWFHGMLMKAGTARTNVVNLATALHREALAMELHHTPGWTSRLFKSIMRRPENASLWQQWEAVYTDLSKPNYRAAARMFYERHRYAMDAGAIVLWPEVEDLYTLMCMRIESGPTAFEREKQNSPVNPDLCEWPEAYFDETIWFEAWPANLAVKTMALDPSKGSDARYGDFSALVMLGMDRQGVLYVEADLARRPTPMIVADGAEWFRRFQPDVFGVESNQFQDLLAGEFEAEFRRQGILAARPAPGVAVPKERKEAGARVKKNRSATVHDKIKLVKSLVKWAVSMGKLRQNPIAGYQLPADGEPENYCYTPAEVRAICAHAGPFFGAVFRFLALTGLRQGELLWLTKADFDAERRVVRIRGKVFAEDDLRWQPKGDDRVVPLSASALAIAQQMFSSTRGRWLFPAPAGPGIVDDRLRPSRLWTQLQRAKQAAGVRRGTLHAFRHFFVSTMANAGASPFKVMRIVGHSSLDIILTYYHVTDEELLSAVDGVDFATVLGDDTAVQKNEESEKVVNS